MNFHLFKTKTCLWRPAMDTINLRENFECVLKVNEQDKPIYGVVLLGSPVGTHAFVANHVSKKALKVHDVLDLVLPLDDAQITLTIHHACLFVALFTHIFKTTPPSQTRGPELILDA